MIIKVVGRWGGDIGSILPVKIFLKRRDFNTYL